MNEQDMDRENALQRRADLQKYYPENFVPPAQSQRPNLPAVTSHSTVIDVPTNAVQVVSVQSSERDRSLGYLLRTIPLSIAFAIVATIVAITLAEEPVLSWTAFVIFWLSLVGAWMFGEWRHGKSSPNAAALEEIKRKWNNIDANDQRRWDAWEKITGIVPVENKQLPVWLERYKWPIILWAAVTFVWMVFVGVVILGGL